MKPQAFDQLLQEYYQAWFRFHPESAVEAGAQGFAERLAPYQDDDMGALRALNEKLLSALSELGCGDLDADRCVEFQVLQGAAGIEHHELSERDWRLRDPARFLPVQAIHQLLLRPVQNFPTALHRRLAAVPEHLRGARQYLQVAPELIPPPWLESAVDEACSGAGYLRDLVSHPRMVKAFPTLGRTAELLEAAAHALEDYARFLEHEVGAVAQGHPGCGREHFERILHCRHFLDLDSDALWEFGDRLLRRTREELKTVTRELRGDDDVEALAASIGGDLPDPDELLNLYRSEMQAAYRFTLDHGLVEVPAQQRLQVVETPVFLRSLIPFAAYVEPSPIDPEQCGYYYVTLPRDAGELREHNLAGLRHTCVHEAWPGHHLQFVTANRHPRSDVWVRFVNTSATLYEGWALYCEQLMHEQGFLGRPEHRFILLRDRLWRALRVRLDVEVQTRGLSLEEGAEQLRRELGFSAAQARSELIWYSRAPGTPQGYASGWAMINEARRRAGEGEGGLRGFHDRLLAHGSIALPLVLQQAFGEELARGVQDTVFARA